MAAIMKQVAVLVLVGLVASLANGEWCPVSFSRSPGGVFTRIESGTNFSIISNTGLSHWKSVAVNGESVTISLSDGSVVERPISELGDAEQAELEEWRDIELEEPLFKLEAGQLLMGPLGRDRLKLVSNTRAGRYIMTDKNIKEQIVVDLSPVASYIFQNNKVATFVNNDCKVQTRSSNSISQ